MNAPNRNRVGLIAFLWMLAILGCASRPPPPPVGPVYVFDAGGRVDLRRYTTLVVQDFQNSVGEELPMEVPTQLPEVVIAHLRECYPKAFARIERTASGTADELVVVGTITRYEKGSRIARFLVRAGEARFTSTVLLADGLTSRKLTEFTVDLVWQGPPGFGAPGVLMGAVVGALAGVDELIEDVGRHVAVGLADLRGLFILRRQELTARRLEMGGVPLDSMKAERCYR